MHTRSKFFQHLALVSVEFFFMISSLFAQDREGVRGILKDVQSGEHLMYANFTLKWTTPGTVTDIDGRYQILNLQPGTYTLVFSYISYRDTEEEIRIREGEIQEVNESMEVEPIMGEEAVVTVMMRGQTAAMNQQIKSNTIVNVVSREKIMELPDQNAAETMARLPGVSLVRDGGEGTKVTLWGMALRFNTITIDGQGADTWDGWKDLQEPDQKLVRDMNNGEVPLEERVFGGEHCLRSHLVQFFKCDRIQVENVKISDSPFWCLHFLYSRNITVRSVVYVTFNFNNHRIDPESSENILIENVVFNNYEDITDIKVGRELEAWTLGIPSRNIVVRNYRFRGHNTIAIGSEMSGGVRDVLIKECGFTGKVEYGFYLKWNWDRGGGRCETSMQVTWNLTAPGPPSSSIPITRTRDPAVLPPLGTSTWRGSGPPVSVNTGSS